MATELSIRNLTTGTERRNLWAAVRPVFEGDPRAPFESHCRLIFADELMFFANLTRVERLFENEATITFRFLDLKNFFRMRTTIEVLLQSYSGLNFSQTYVVAPEKALGLLVTLFSIVRRPQDIV